MRIDDFIAIARIKFANDRDFAIANANIAMRCRRAGPVDDPPIFNNDIEASRE